MKELESFVEECNFSKSRKVSKTCETKMQNSEACIGRSFKSTFFLFLETEMTAKNFRMLYVLYSEVLW